MCALVTISSFIWLGLAISQWIFETLTGSHSPSPGSSSNLPGSESSLCVLVLLQSAIPERKIWSTVKLCGPALPTRLDHAMCIAEIPGPASSQTPAESAGAVETAAVCAGRGETDGQLMTILSADRKASGPVALSSLLPPLGNGKRLVLCVLGGVNMFASRPEDQMFKEFALLQITP